MIRVFFDLSGPKFLPDQAVHLATDGLDVLLRVVRVTIDAGWRQVCDTIPPDEDLDPIASGVVSGHRPSYVARVIEVNETGGRAIRPGQLVMFGEGLMATASAVEFEAHGEVIQDMPSVRKRQGDKLRRQLLKDAEADILAQYLQARREQGVRCPLIILRQMDPDGFGRIGPRGTELAEYDVLSYEFEPRLFDGPIPEGHFPVMIVTMDCAGTHATLPIPAGEGV